MSVGEAGPPSRSSTEAGTETKPRRGVCLPTTTKGEDHDHTEGRETEPLDPALDKPIHSTRGDTPFAPQGYFSELDDRFVWETGSYVKTLAQARRAQRRDLLGEFEAARRNGWKLNARQWYDRVMNTGRMCHRDYENPHTVMISLRISPTQGDHWIPHVTMMEEVYQALRRRAMDRLRRQLSDHDWEYVAVIAGTDHFATPHYHLYLWIDGHVERDDFAGVVEAFVEDCKYAPSDGEGNRVDDGAVTVQGPDEQQWATDEVRQDMLEERGPVTEGAVYVASQIPNITHPDKATDAQLEHGATADAFDHTAVSFSQGCHRRDRDGKVSIDNSIHSPRTHPSSDTPTSPETETSPEPTTQSRGAGGPDAHGSSCPPRHQRIKRFEGAGRPDLLALLHAVHPPFVVEGLRPTLFSSTASGISPPTLPEWDTDGTTDTPTEPRILPQSRATGKDGPHLSDK